MQTILIHIICRIAAVVGVKSDAKQCITNLLHSQSMREAAVYADAAEVDIVRGIVDKHFDKAWEITHEEPCVDVEMHAARLCATLLELAGAV